MQCLVATPHNVLSARKRPLSRNPDSSYTLGFTNSCLNVTLIGRNNVYSKESFSRSFLLSLATTKILNCLLRVCRLRCKIFVPSTYRSGESKRLISVYNHLRLICNMEVSHLHCEGYISSFAPIYMTL